MWPNPQETVDLVIFTEKILDEKLYFLCNVWGKRKGLVIRGLKMYVDIYIYV